MREEEKRTEEPSSRAKRFEWGQQTSKNRTPLRPLKRSNKKSDSAKEKRESSTRNNNTKAHWNSLLEILQRPLEELQSDKAHVDIRARLRQNPATPEAKNRKAGRAKHTKKDQGTRGGKMQEGSSGSKNYPAAEVEQTVLKHKGTAGKGKQPNNDQEVLEETLALERKDRSSGA